MVRVMYVGIIKSILGLREEQVEMPEGTTIMTLLKYLEEKHGSKFAKQVMDPDTSIREEALIIVDGNNIESLQGTRTPLPKSSEALVVILSSVSAGG
ncbi:MAG TPA: MoaD/ThiS family protein [Nitrososphaerales archaeon]|nr:MoaD/ThiS family protein [Nitrososphaerales archaeon]